jgi:hypothetical protein
VLKWKPIPSPGPANKLIKKWTGPYEIVAKTCPVNYKIELSTGRKKAFIVHVEALKPYILRTVDSEQDELNLVHGSPELVECEIPSGSDMVDAYESRSHDLTEQLETRETVTVAEDMGARPKRSTKRPQRYRSE